MEGAGPSCPAPALMHTLHCVLVRFEGVKKEYENLDANAEDVQDLVEDFRHEALSVTEYYQDRAYDWRAEDAGRWADEYPNRGVVLGLTDPELFLELLERWKDEPFRAALEKLELATHTGHAWRTPEEMVRDGAVALRAPREDGACWSAVPVQIPPVGMELLARLWDDAPGFWSYSIRNAVSLAAGKYLPESGFYSAPDHSSKISPETLRSAQEHPEQFALVFLDYHY